MQLQLRIGEAMKSLLSGLFLLLLGTSAAAAEPAAAPELIAAALKDRSAEFAVVSPYDLQKSSAAIFDLSVPGGMDFEKNPVMELIGSLSLSVLSVKASLSGVRLPRAVNLIGTPSGLTVRVSGFERDGPASISTRMEQSGPVFTGSGRWLVVLMRVDESAFSGLSAEHVAYLRKRGQGFFALYGEGRAGYRLLKPDASAPAYEITLPLEFLKDLKKLLKAVKPLRLGKKPESEVLAPAKLEKLSKAMSTSEGAEVIRRLPEAKPLPPMGRSSLEGGAAAAQNGAPANACVPDVCGRINGTWKGTCVP
jgi:hypothetical protein